MKVIIYLGKRLAILTIGIILLYYGAYYTLPKNIQEDGFGFIAEIDRIFTLSSAFSLLFLIYLFIEIKKFKKNKNVKLENAAIFLSIFTLIITTILFVFQRIYSS